MLDQLLADGRIAIDSISGASAGAVNAVMLADGLARGGPEEARQRLADFWRAASFGGALPELQREAIERLFAFVPRQSSPVPWLGALSRYWSPYDLNPLNINPLKSLIERFVDFAQVRGDTRRELFISATNVHSGEQRVFSRAEMTRGSRDGVGLPAAVVPGGGDRRRALLGRRLQRQPVGAAVPARDVDGRRADRADQSARARRPPTSARDIMTRLHELTFNAPLLAELRALELAERLITEGGLPRGTAPGQYRRIRLHRIVMDADIAFDDRSKLNNDYEFFDRLRQLGQAAAQRFLDEHFGDIGRKSTIDLTAEAAPKWLDRRPVTAEASAACRC